MNEDAIRDCLKRAIYICEHLMQMIDDETWKNSGGDDGQGHYEGLYQRDKLDEEIQWWKVLVK